VEQLISVVMQHCSHDDDDDDDESVDDRYYARFDSDTRQAVAPTYHPDVSFYLCFVSTDVTSVH